MEEKEKMEEKKLRIKYTYVEFWEYDFRKEITNGALSLISCLGVNLDRNFWQCFSEFRGILGFIKFDINQNEYRFIPCNSEGLPMKNDYSWHEMKDIALFLSSLEDGSWEKMGELFNKQGSDLRGTRERSSRRLTPRDI